MGTSQVRQAATKRHGRQLNKNKGADDVEIL
jgi:hypothetical protein